MAKSNTHSSALQEEVFLLLQKQAIIAVLPSDLQDGFYSRYFTVPKKDGGLCPIFDLRHLSKYIQRFRMVTLDPVIPLLSQGDWFVMISLQDAYFHIAIHPRHHKYLRFHFDGTTYQFCTFLFGLSTAPSTFAKCLAPVAAHLSL